MYALMRHFCETNLQEVPTMQLQRESFEAACSVLDAILDLKRRKVLDWHQAVRNLQHLQIAHRQAHERAYGTGLVIPKDHIAFHLPAQLHQDGFVLDMFVIERINIRVKNAAEHVRNTRRYEFSALSTVLTAQRNFVSGQEPWHGLIGGQKGGGLGFDALVARGVKWYDREFSEQDVVMCGSLVGIVMAGMQQGQSLFVMVRAMLPVGPRTRSSATYTVTSDLLTFAVEDTFEAIAWYAEGSNIVVIW